MTFSVSLPFPPSVNNLFISRGKKRVSSARAVAYTLAAHKALAAEGWPCAPTGELRAVIAVWVPDRRRRDLDNLFKAPLDALVKAKALADDSLIVDLRIYRAGLDKENPRITIWLEANA